MEKAYNHNGSEDNLYKNWEASGEMRANEHSDKPPFTIPLPPPNVTGELHLGHAAMLAIEDIMIRYKKMRGHEVLWVPGTDHAAIATENVVLKHLGQPSREVYSREDFLGHCRDFAGEKHDNIVNQMKKMGSWLDWSREAYTFDEERNNSVNLIFKQLYEDGLIERGYRLINWSTGAQSVISDDELEWDEIKESFFYIKCGKFVMGTVRPETKCANSPLVVHPDEAYVEIKITDTETQETENLIIIKRLFDDKEKFFKTLNFLNPEAQYEVINTSLGKELEGQKFSAETYAGKRDFYVLADEVIDPEKGTGAMTISASHSADDYNLAKRKKLNETFIEKINLEGKMTDVAGPVAGMEVKKARNVSGKLMQEKGLLVGKDTNYQHRVPLCYRSGSVVEPMISPQWFVMVEKEYTHSVDGKTTLKKQMQAAVRENHVDIIPSRFEKTYFHWIDNLQDWCISRQIWWGHRIPVWYDKNNNIVATGELTPDQEKLNLRQDEDTLDTWFSSALWPFSTLGWPNEEAPDFQKFYNNTVNGQGTDVLETGWDILFFWVARMIMFGRYATNKYPFHTVYLHGLVTDEKGKKMSKSKGNGIDPLIMIDKFGADAVRLALVIGSSPGNPIPIGENKIKGYRNFVNKLWNAGRFIGMQNGENTIQQVSLEDLKTQELSLPDQWILSKLSRTTETVTQALEKYEISTAGDTMYHFVWDDFCDWYLEASKVKPNLVVLNFVYQQILKLIHPMCPFVTEQIWKELFKEETFIVNEDFPEINLVDELSEKNFALLQKITNEIRKIRAEKNLNPKDKIKSLIKGKTEVTKSLNPDLIISLANLSDLEIDELITKPEHSATIIIDDLEIFVEIPFDKDTEIKRLTKESEILSKKIENLTARLNNKSYTDKAPKALVDQTMAEKEKSALELEKILKELNTLIQ